MSYAAPFKGLKVVDLSQGVAGPYCAMMLAQYGANVIKVEPVDTGDWSRALGKTYGDHTAYSIPANVGKRSIALDLKQPSGRDVLWRLIHGADVFVQGFRPGVIDRLGFGYTAVAFSSVAIAVFGFLVWAHHMFIMGISNYSALVFSLLTMLVAVPSAIKIFNWSATLYKGSITFETPMLYAFGFIGLFTIGGLTGVFLGSMGMDIHLTETYFIVAHFHFVMVGGMLMAYLAGVHFWWPKITGRMYPEGVSRLAAVITFVGFILTFFPQFVLGYLGMPRRYAAYPPEFQVLNVFSSAGASVLGIGYLLPLLYLQRSLKYGKIAGSNPWQATGLEWQIQSPPLTENFATTPIVTHEAYDYDWLADKTRNEVTTVG